MVKVSIKTWGEYYEKRKLFLVKHLKDSIKWGLAEAKIFVDSKEKVLTNEEFEMFDILFVKRLRNSEVNAIQYNTTIILDQD
jgi:hypothetical protein